ncbi:hypothetical protein J2128_000243 [Methanomicrobium sp. W14]|uniref:Yip1 family protein n=1 Tax=Methanomicrobium sp. W14 TaxID=2817839 RepID=UPI001AEA1DFB|nr:Yip1 family protein [Methanomicrobium sp. W14]MBP2132322.1 hypothetical protein [Methanomicrobium sp. W14]
MQPHDDYNSNYGRSEKPASQVRVGGRLYSLMLDPENMTLNPVSDRGVSPYVYPYSVISGLHPLSDDYHEPCIEVTISYGETDNVSMVMTFDYEDERNSVLMQIKSYMDSAGSAHDKGYEKYPDGSVGAGDKYAESGYDPEVYSPKRGYSEDKYAESSYGPDEYSPKRGYSEDKYAESGYGPDEYSPKRGYSEDKYAESGYGPDGYSPNRGHYRDEYTDADSDFGKSGESEYESYSSYGDYDSNSRKYDPRDSGYRQSSGDYRYSVGDLSLIEKISGFIRSPSETFETLGSEDDLKSGILYGFLMLALFSVIGVLLTALLASAFAPESTVYGGLLSSTPELVRMILEYLIFGALCIFFYGLLVFLFTKITGQDLLFSESFATTLYSTTAIGTIGLIPLFGLFIGPLWMVFLQIKGLCCAYDAETVPAAVSAIAPAVIMFIVFYYFVLSGEVAFI